MNATRNCAFCGNAVTGRQDKKFCSDQCRYLFNNQSKAESQRGILDVNKRLRKNRSILKSLCPHGKATVRRTVLADLGFDITVFTSLFVTSTKQVYYLCYEYGFSPIVERGIQKAIIISRQPYMSVWDPWKFVKKASEERNIPGT